MNAVDATALDPEVEIRLPLSIWNVIYVHLVSAGPIAAATAGVIAAQAAPQVEAVARALGLRTAPDLSTTPTLN